MPAAPQPLRAAVAGLGPLRWVVLAVVIGPTAGLLVLLGNLGALAAAWPPGVAGIAAAIAAIALATGAVLLPPSIAAFAAGWCLGAPGGGAAAVLGLGLGGLFGQRVVWPLFGGRLYAFMQGRPRLVAVQRCCAAEGGRLVLRVAALRAAASVPFSVQNLLLSAARVPAGAVLLGGWLGPVPFAALAAGLGAAARRWRVDGALPGALALAALAGLFVAAVATVAVARRVVARAAGTARPA